MNKLTIQVLLALIFTFACSKSDGTGESTKDPQTLTVLSTTPKDGALGFQLNTAITVTFSQPLSASTVTTSTTTACTGSIQVSTNNFTSCIAMTSATPALSGGGSLVTITPAANLTAATTYKLRVTTAVNSTISQALASVYTSATGFSSNTYTLTVNRTGGGTDAIASSPAGITCGGDCTESYMGDTVVTLTPASSVSSTLASWSGGGCSGTGNCAVTMQGNTTVTGNFIINNYNVNVNKTGTGTGTVTGTGINCGGDCSETYDHGSSVTLTAAPTSLSYFVGWSGGGCSGTGTCSVTVDGAKNITAEFAPRELTVTINSGTGTLSSSPAGINCPGDCTEAYNASTVVVITASSAVTWSGCQSMTASTCTVTMSTAKSVTVIFP